MALAQLKVVYLLALCSNHRKSFLPKSVLGNWWRQVATASGLQTIPLCCSSLHSISLKHCFVSGGCYLNWSSIFVTDALRGESEAWKILKNGLWQGSREVVWSVFCFSFVRCQQNALLCGGEPFLLFPGSVMSPLQGCLIHDAHPQGFEAGGVEAIKGHKYKINIAYFPLFLGHQLYPMVSKFKCYLM